MKTKTYKHGKYTYKAYLKTVGRGYEVGFMWGKKLLFVGNFLTAKEANAWYSQMNREMTKFAKKYWVTNRAPRTFYNKFIKNALYKSYYSFLDKHFSKYNREFNREFNKDLRKYNQLKKQWHHTEKVGLKAA